MTNTSKAVLCLDSGLRSAGQNNAVDRLWLQQHERGERPASLRFHQSTPAASLGLHQAADRELRLDYCRARGIEVLRRPGGGGALYLDEDQVGFSLIVPWPEEGTLAAVLRRGCAGVAGGLARLGVAADYKFPNDLEVAGRKIASVFAARNGASLLLQGIVLVDADIRTMLEALRTPTEKLSADGLAAARDRLATLKECLGRVPLLAEVRQALRLGLAEAFALALAGEELRPVELGLGPRAVDEERELAGRIDWSAPDGHWVEVLGKGTGATLRLRAQFTPDERRFAAVEFSGDMVCHPPTLLRSLGRALAGLPLGLADRCLDDFLARQAFDVVGFDGADLRQLVHLVADKQGMRRQLGISRSQANAVMVFSPRGSRSMKDILERATVMLVPYCAKPAWCKWRHLDGCSECGLCEVGEAYRMARERAMHVVTVTNYEHLVDTLAAMKEEGTPAYVGMCCSNFYLKRHRAFQEAGMPAVLMDISGANCYELKQEDQAYAGRFKAEAKLDDDLLAKVMRLVPARE